MPYCIVVANVKGGVAKTTTAINIAYGLGLAQRRVLLIDMDPQCNTTFAIAGNIALVPNMLEVMLAGRSLDYEVIRKVEQVSNIWFAPGSIDLVAADIQLGPVPGRERILTRALAPVLADFDYIIIDTSPNLGLLAVNAMVAAKNTGMLIPVALNTFALVGFTILENVSQQLRDNLEIPLPVFGVLPTMYDSATTSSKQSLQIVQEHFKEQVFPTVIPKNIDIEKAHNTQTCLYRQYPRSSGAMAYALATEEVIRRAEG